MSATGMFISASPRGTSITMPPKVTALRSLLVWMIYTRALGSLTQDTDILANRRRQRRCYDITQHLLFKHNS